MNDGAPNESRTRVSGLKGQRPGPLDDGSKSASLMPCGNEPLFETEAVDFSASRTMRAQTRVCSPDVLAPDIEPKTPEQRTDELLQHLIEGRYQFPVDVGPARRAFLERVESLRHVDREPCHRCGHADWFVPEHHAYKVCKVCRSTEMLGR